MGQQAACGARTGVGRRRQLRKAVVLEHVQQGRLSGIVQAEEEELGVLAVQPCIEKKGGRWAGEKKGERERGAGEKKGGTRDG